MSQVTDPERMKEFWNAQHFNENRAVGIGIKTTGKDSKKHEIIQICVFPLTSRFKLATEILPFYTDIKPLKNKEDFEITSSGLMTEKFNAIINNATTTPQIAAEIFDSWMEKQIKMKFGKKLLPVTYNWAFIKPFIKNWLGPINFDHYFSHEYRDIMSVALFCNDYGDTHTLETLYPKTKLAYICNMLNVEYSRYDDTILNVKSMSEVYQGMLKNFISTPA